MEEMTLSEFVNVLQNICHEGKSNYKIKINNENARFSGFYTDKEKEEINIIIK